MNLASDYIEDNEESKALLSNTINDVSAKTDLSIGGKKSTKSRKNVSASNTIAEVDEMDGHEFEKWCAKLLGENAFEGVSLTKASGDQGVDVLAAKDGIKYAFQCKCYASDLSNTPVQEVAAGMKLYKCHVGVVMTNRHFSSGAKELAAATGVLLWDREKLISMIPHKTEVQGEEAFDADSIIAEFKE